MKCMQLPRIHLHMVIVNTVCVVCVCICGQSVRIVGYVSMQQLHGVGVCGSFRISSGEVLILSGSQSLNGSAGLGII